MRVSQIMTQPVITISEDAPLHEIARIMLEHGIGGIPVVDESGGLTGIITESDFTASEKGVPFSRFRAPQLFGSWLGNNADELYSRARNIPARDIMSRGVITVTENDSIEAVLNLILKHDINRILVVRDRKPVGIVARHDLLRMMKTEPARVADQKSENESLLKFRIARERSSDRRPGETRH